MVIFFFDRMEDVLWTFGKRSMKYIHLEEGAATSWK